MATITYKWQNVKVNVPHGEHTKEEIKDIDYDYEVDITMEDIMNYLTYVKAPFYWLAKDILNKKDGDEIETSAKKIYNLTTSYLRSMFDLMYDTNALDLNQLINDEDFYSFLYSRYEEIAVEMFDEENERY